MKILPFHKDTPFDDLLSKVKSFTDREIGEGYYHREQLREYLSEPACSFLLVNKEKEIQGIRLTLPPAKLARHPIFQKCSPSLWPSPPEKTAYFQSLFIAPTHQRKGWGQKLSETSLQALRSLDTEAVVCHAWKESPEDSSRRYLKSMGFTAVTEHAEFWRDRPYTCTRCGSPCVCTAVEMIKEIP